MELSGLDWGIIILFLLFILGIGIFYTPQAGKDTKSFFLGGRNLPWWIAGTSMVATTFAADTPLLITEIVANNGISGNWLWWNGLIGGMVATFFFARYWHKAGIMTDVELIELRYAGQPASFLRGFKAVYLGVFLNSVIIAWVNIALATLLKGFFGIPDSQILYYLAGAMFFVMIYSSLSGLLGVSIADFFQFILAMTGTIILAFLVVNSEEIGGISGLKEKLPPETFAFLPQLNFSGQTIADQGQVFIISFATFFAFVGVQWWASWYPGAEPGGGGYVAQRMMSTPKEKDAIKATLFFQIAHYAIRPLPWILVALCAIHLYPDLGPEEKKMGYVLAMRDFLPSGLRGLLLVAFLAAYMSTISTQLNWGSSYVINDLYQRFIRPEANQKQLVRASRMATFLLMVVALIVTSQIKTLEGAFLFMIQAGAGLGAVLILRWYWWRINAWSEISATLAPFLGYYLAEYFFKIEAPFGFFFTVGFTTFVWLLVTFLTKPTPIRKLKDFYLRVEPQGAWKPVIQELGISSPPNQIPKLLLACVSAMLMAYSILFLAGELLLMNWTSAPIYGIILVVSLLTLRWVSGSLKIFED